MKGYLFSSTMLSLVAAASASGATIAQTKLQATNTPATVSNAVVAYILDSGSTFNNSTLLLSDATGSLEAFRVGTIANATNTAPYPTPTVGDNITITSNYQLFNNLSELTGTTTTPFSVTVNSQNNAVPAPKAYTIADLQDGSANGELYESTVGTLSGVHFVTPGGTFAAATSYTVTDATGTLTTTLRTQSAGTSSQASLIGMTIPSGDVNVFGAFTQFSSTNATGGYQFNPIAVTTAPEPAALGLMGISGLLILRCRRA